MPINRFLSCCFSRFNQYISWNQFEQLKWSIFLTSYECGKKIPLDFSIALMDGSRNDVNAIFCHRKNWGPEKRFVDSRRLFLVTRKRKMVGGLRIFSKFEINIFCFSTAGQKKKFSLFSIFSEIYSWMRKKKN